ncbi:iron-sulfur cluster assembly 1-like protein, mitochondrial isoform A [Alligator mississippiensis]|uniref:Iron-sulfur cluster assembly 1-like protein, mitochondrial isoform A n=1 Tax=Alligator mississippiensis TaxID=8496 RepID=A0A151M884_ALLMI|nr:iron-sulfur cluster assembly 1-like protein, mitochondrial isoform A [Alligator mississippiensis]
MLSFLLQEYRFQSKTWHGYITVAVVGHQGNQGAKKLHAWPPDQIYRSNLGNSRISFKGFAFMTEVRGCPGRSGLLSRQAVGKPSHPCCFPRCCNLRSLQNQMNQTENDKPHSGHEEKKQLFLSNWKVPELLSCLANVKNGEPTHQLLLKGTHASLFHTEKPKPLSKISPISELQKIEETQHIKFLNLKDLQWKLYKGIVKRKQKVTASQREANYRPFRIFEEKTTKAEYIIPLISKN